MNNKDMVESSVIEAEILDEDGRPLNGPKPAPNMQRGVLTMLKAISVLTGVFLFSLLMMLLFILLFLPLLLLKALGLFKGEMKFYKWPKP